MPCALFMLESEHVAKAVLVFCLQHALDSHTIGIDNERISLQTWSPPCFGPRCNSKGDNGSDREDSDRIMKTSLRRLEPTRKCVIAVTEIEAAVLATRKSKLRAIDNDRKARQ